MKRFLAVLLFLGALSSSVSAAPMPGGQINGLTVTSSSVADYFAGGAYNIRLEMTSPYSLGNGISCSFMYINSADNSADIMTRALLAGFLAQKNFSLDFDTYDNTSSAAYCHIVGVRIKR